MTLSALISRHPTLTALAFCALCAPPGAVAASAAAPATSVQVTTVMPQQTRFNQPVHGYGSLTPPPGARHAVTLPWSGVIEAIAVHPGQRVKAGAALLTVAPDPGARAAWKRARAARDAARVALHQSEHLHADGLATSADLAQAHRALHDAEAEVQAQRRLGGARARTTLHAPIAGIVGGLPTSAGVRFSAGTVLASVVPAARRRRSGWR
jgi:Membrane-fusion protein